MLQVSGELARFCQAATAEQHGEGSSLKCHGFQRHVAGALNRPLIVLFQEDGADEGG